MWTFVLLCFAVVASADKLNYNFNPIMYSGLSYTPGYSSYECVSSSYPKLTTKIYNELSGSVAYNTPINFGGYQTEFYTFTAPDAVFDDDAEVEKLIRSLKKKIRVIFIKSPEDKAYENAILALAKQAAEQKTIIYLLNRQSEVSELAEKFNAIYSSHNSKPEVHFVKYHTPEDAANAQEIIQGQYDSLGSFSRSYNGGIAPALNYASQDLHAIHGSGMGHSNEYMTPTE